MCHQTRLGLVQGDHCEQSSWKCKGISSWFENAKKDFNTRLNTIDWNKFYLENPFKNSGLALYNWSPIADELKVLDKEIVLNSIMLKWNLVENDFKDLTKNLTFN